MRKTFKVDLKKVRELFPSEANSKNFLDYYFTYICENWQNGNIGDCKQNIFNLTKEQKCKFCLALMGENESIRDFRNELKLRLLKITILQLGGYE